ncbi:hypothetical protein KY290_021391 [Solanum tuberosum]|uniref:Integrase core domain containing protein n=1 Tax=Solanum tuberosum TaxID=4113 RepID=A0ABQ7V3H5_SOLTU|nr:hypothetical protein KY289_020555 [Solanum tuberosum]KAH0693222.1 hypothetical protein KY285_020319 [Solanum tuberosum]KAH0757898.1 hypothetical protein KY290_021391 [Solanum tuberosum]
MGCYLYIARVGLERVITPLGSSTPCYDLGVLPGRDRDSLSGSGKELGCESNAGSGSQSNDSSRGNAEFKGGSQDDTTVHIAAETGAQEVVGIVGEDEEITTNDTMVFYVNIHEPDPATRQ